MLLDRRIPLGYIFKQIRKDLLFVLACIVANHFIEYYIFSFDIDISIPSILGITISLLLSFKLNQSYNRWWEARKIWGSIVNDSRSLVIQLLQYVKENPIKNEIVINIAKLQILWCYSLVVYLRKIDLDSRIVNTYLPKEHVENWNNAVHKPLYVQKLQSRYLRDLKTDSQINNFQEISLNNTIVRLCDSMGKAERIKNTVFPIAYRTYLHYSIYLFLCLLGMSITTINSYWEAILITFISIPFFLLEKTAFLMQDPFENRPSDVCIEDISKKIEIAILELIPLDVDYIDKPNDTKFYIL